MINQMFDHFDRTLCRAKFDQSFDYITVNQTNALICKILISLGHRCEAQYFLCRRHGVLGSKEYVLEPFSIKEMHSSLVECTLVPTFCYNL
jgi:hypothetical protein